MRPLVPVLLAFAAGIITSGRLDLSNETYYLFIAVSFLVILLAHLRGFKFTYLLIAPPFFFLGAVFILPYVKPALPPDHISNYIKRTELLEAAPVRLPKAASYMDIEGEVINTSYAAGERTRLSVEAKGIYNDGLMHETNGTVLLALEGAGRGLKAGDRVRFFTRLKEPFNYGNPGEYDYRWRLNSKGIYATGYINNERLIIKLSDGKRGFLSHVEDFRTGVRSFLDATGSMHRESLKALLIGEKSGIDRDVQEAFVKTGTAHILAISGLHVGIVAFFSYGIFLFILKRSERLILAINIKKAALILSLFPVAGYGFLSGFPVSAQRAVAMAFAYVFTAVINRGKNLYNILALAALIILVIEPYALWEISFQLTFAAVFSIVYLLPRLNGFLPEKPADEFGGGDWFGSTLSRFRRWIIPAGLTTVAAALGTGPILAYHFHRVSITGVAANLIVVPLTGAVVPLLIISAALLPFWAWGAGAGFFFSDILFDVIVRVIKFFAGLPYSSVWVSTPTILEVILFYALIVSVSNIKKGRLYRFITPVVVLLMLLDWGYWNYHGRWNRSLKVTFISVGQGDCALVEFPGGATMLIDGGGLYGTEFDTGERIIAPLLWHKKIGRIDYMVLSHAQRDHMAGLKFVAGNFKVGEFWWNGDGRLGELKRLISNGAAPVRVVSAASGGRVINGVAVEVLNPVNPPEADPNNRSLVLRLTYGERAFLFTGDIGAEAERLLSKRPIRAAVLKSPHHGSRYSSTVSFLEAVRPSVVVISVGRLNPFGFPHVETLSAYRRSGARVFRTDVDGAVEVETDGRGLKALAYLTGRGL